MDRMFSVYSMTGFTFKINAKQNVNFYDIYQCFMFLPLLSSHVFSITFDSVHQPLFPFPPSSL